MQPLEHQTADVASLDHALLDRMTWKRACRLATQNGYDLIDHATGDMVTEWWGFAWMILAEARGVLTPENRAAAWRKHDERVMTEPKVVAVIRERTTR